MSVEQSVEWELLREVLGEKPALLLLCPPHNPHHLSSNPGRRSGKLVTNHLSYGMANNILRHFLTGLHSGKIQDFHSEDSWFECRERFFFPSGKRQDGTKINGHFLPNPFQFKHAKM
jgi:hypothetical protein